MQLLEHASEAKPSRPRIWTHLSPSRSRPIQSQPFHCVCWTPKRWSTSLLIIRTFQPHHQVLTPPDSLGPVPGEYLAHLSKFSFHSRLAFCGARAALRISMRATYGCILHVPHCHHLFECLPLFANSRFFLLFLFFAASNACLMFRLFFPATTIAFLQVNFKLILLDTRPCCMRPCSDTR